MRRSTSLKPFTTEDLDNRFLYHKPTGKHLVVHETFRENVRLFAQLTLAYLPNSREKALFLTKLEEASFWGHAAIARNELP